MGKLVRDLIPDLMRAEDLHVQYRAMDQPEFEHALMDKLFEEAAELAAAKSDPERLEEAADVYEVLCEVVRTFGASIEEVALSAEVKRRDKGGFSRRLWLEG